MKKFFCLISSLVFLASCSSAQKTTDNREDPTTWQGVLRMWCESYDINDDAKRMAVVDQIISVFDMIDDTTIAAEWLEEPICIMKENIEHVIDTDGYFEFVQMMRASARNLTGRMLNDTRLHTDCAFELMMRDGLWQTSSEDSLDFMATSLFYNSWQAFARKTNIILTKHDKRESMEAVMIFTNFIDTAMDNLKVIFIKGKDTAMVITEKDMYVDNSDAYAGVKRAFLPPSLLLEALLTTNVVTISYNTPNEHVEYIGYPQMYFEAQVTNCPRLVAVLNEIKSKDD